MNLNLTAKLNIKSNDIESKFYLVIMALITSLFAVWIYSFAMTTYSEEEIDATTGFNRLRPRLNEEIKVPETKIVPKS